MQSRSVTEAGTTRFDSCANQRVFLIGTHAADFPSGPAAYGLHKQAGHMKATVRIASPKKALAHRGRPHMNQCCVLLSNSESLLLIRS
jgi:hypothetical protein